jgi:hypothetical protein
MLTDNDLINGIRGMLEIQRDNPFSSDASTRARNVNVRLFAIAAERGLSTSICDLSTDARDHVALVYVRSASRYSHTKG